MKKTLSFRDKANIEECVQKHEVRLYHASDTGIYLKWVPYHKWFLVGKDSDQIVYEYSTLESAINGLDRMIDNA